MTNDLSDTLAALSAKATQGLIEACAPGDYGDFDGESRVICSADPDDMRRIAVVHWHEGHPETDANTELLVGLWNAHRSGQLVPVPSVEMVARAVHAANNNPEIYAWFHADAQHCRKSKGIATAIIAALKGETK